jgi:hypothetical protein
MDSSMSDGKRASDPPWASGEIPKTLIYIYPVPEDLENRYQLQWDYQIEWPIVGRHNQALALSQLSTKHGGWQSGTC